MTDSWFAFIVISRLYEQVWLSSLLFGAEYLLLAGGLWWFNKYLVVAYKDHHGADDDSGGRTGDNPGHKAPKTAAAVFGKNKTIATATTTTSRVRYLQILVAATLIGGMLSYRFMTSHATKSEELILPANADSVLMIGALLPLTGTRSSYAQEYEAALNIAIDDANEHLAKTGSTNRIGLAIEDTKTDPQSRLKNSRS